MSQSEERGTGRGAIALLVGLVGAAVIWITVPYVNYIIGLQNMSDSYLPAAAVLLILVLVLGVNPLLARLAPRWRFDFRQIALMAGIWLCAGAIPGTGLMQMLPYAISDFPHKVSTTRELAQAVEKMDLPPALFPAELRFGARLPNIEAFSTELLPGRSIPWGVWLPPLWAWGTFLLFLWVMMAGLAMIASTQWFRHERLAFPLLKLERSLIETPRPGTLLPPIFRHKAFWFAAAIVFVLRFLEGMEAYKPGMWPRVPLNWNLERLFTEGVFQHLHDAIYGGHFYFLLAGMAFFMPNRISFSIWFFTLVYAFYIAIGTAYFPPFAKETIYDQRMGAMIAMSAGVLWLGRMHWFHVARCMFDLRAASPEERRDRLAGWALAAGCIGMFAWLVWAKVQPGWAAFFVGFGVMISLLMARVVAETGLPFVSFDLRYHILLIKLAPISWLSTPTLLFSGVLAMFYSSRIMFATIGMHALGLDPTLPPKRHGRFFATMIAVLLVGVVVSGGAHLYYGYHHSMSLDAKYQPVNPKGRGQQLTTARADILAFERGTVNLPGHNQWKHLSIGAGLAGFLQWACIAMPRWPLHPIGLVLAKSAYADWAWPSLFVGWLLKLAILRYGGSRLFRTLTPLIIGTMVGEVFAALFWSLVPTILALCGMPYVAVNVLPTTT